jgi:hypothetical protein
MVAAAVVAAMVEVDTVVVAVVVEVSTVCPLTPPFHR